MVEVSYALREDPSTIYLLQDAGRQYDKYCQITVFGRNIVRPEFLRQYMYFAPYIGNNGKYRGAATDVQISIEDNEFLPRRDYVVVIDSEVEFRITTSVISQLSREYMPAWGMKSYLDYFSDRKSGILLFLRVYEANLNLPPVYLEKGLRGRSQIIKLYDEWEEEISLPIKVITPILSDNKFSYLKDEILHLLKVENALIAQYDSTAAGMNRLQERVIADKHIQGTSERWKNRHLQWINFAPDDDDDFDMAQLDYESIYREVLEICPNMTDVIEFVKKIQPARLGEYDYYLKDVHMHTENEEKSSYRLFEMSLRAAVKTALYYHKKYDFDLEDTFQEACIGIMMAIKKHNENVAGRFPSYVAMWMRQVLDRDQSPYYRNMRVPIHYCNRIDQILDKLSETFYGFDYKEMTQNELYHSILKYTDCDEQEALRLSYILIPAQSLEELLSNPSKENLLVDDMDVLEKTISLITNEDIQEIMDTLSQREKDVISSRFGFDDGQEKTLETIGKKYRLTRERVRQIEVKAKHKILAHYYMNGRITKMQYDLYKLLMGHSWKEEEKNELLLTAYSIGDFNKATLLLEAGANINGRGKDGQVLMIRALEQNRGLVKTLIKAGANVNVQSVDGKTPLMVAAHKANYYLIRDLINAGADTSMVDHEGHNALWYLNQCLTVDNKYKGYLKGLLK